MDALPETRVVAADAERMRLLKQAIGRRLHVPGDSIAWELDDATVVLRGQVRSFYLKQLAQSVVLGVPGIRRVIDEIEVEGRRAGGGDAAADAG